MTRHAPFLALHWAPRAVLAHLVNLEHDFAIYGKWGFRDSVNVQTGAVSNSYLSLGQGILMGAIGNELGHGVLRRAFATKEIKQAPKPIISMEEFNAGPRNRAAQVDRP